MLRTNWLMSKHVQVLQQGPTTCCMWTLLVYMDAHTCFNFLLCQIPGKNNSFDQTKVTAKIGSEPNGACYAIKPKFHKTECTTNLDARIRLTVLESKYANMDL